MPDEPPNPADNDYISDPDAFWEDAYEWHKIAEEWRDAVRLLALPSGGHPDWASIEDLFERLDDIPKIPSSQIPDEIDSFPDVPEVPTFVPSELPDAPPAFPEIDPNVGVDDGFGALPTLDGSVNVSVPEAEEAIEEFDGERPLQPELDEPPIPNAFWAALDDMHGQLFEFDPYEFLTDEIRAAVYSQIGNFDEYLGFARLDLASQFAENVAMLFDMRFGYIEYLAELRAAAIDAETAEMSNLRERVEAFHEIATHRSDDTRERLADFSAMLPLSRTYVGVNREMVDFAAQPIEFVQPVLRGEIVTDISVEAGFPAWWLWLAMGVFGTTVIGVMGYTFFEAMRIEGKRVRKTK
jgi:hypothetical protein